MGIRYLRLCALCRPSNQCAAFERLVTEMPRGLLRKTCWLFVQTLELPDLSTEVGQVP